MNPDQETERSAMVDRQRLPNRRGNVSFGFKYEGFDYRATAGHFDDGRLAEIFLDVPGKLGTPLQSNANTRPTGCGTWPAPHWQRRGLA